MTQQTRAPTGNVGTGGTVGYSSGTSAFALTNDYPDTADPLTSYVQLGTTANSFFTCSFSNFTVPTDVTINFVEVQYTDEEPSTGTNSSCARIRVNSTYYDKTSTTNAPSTTTTTRTGTNNRWTTNPATSQAWTVAVVNNDGGTGLNAFGVLGPDSNPVFRVGSIQLVVDYTLAPIARPTDVGALTITGFAPTVFAQDPKAAAPGAGALELAGNAPQRVVNTTVAAGVGGLTLTGYAPQTNRLWVSWVDFEIPAQDPVSITAGVGALSLTGYSPTVFAADPKTANPGVGALALTGFEPTPAIGGGISPNITTDVGALTLTGYSPTAGKTESVVAGVGALTITGYAPTAGGSERLRVSWVDLEIPAQDPVAITAGVGALSFAGNVPTANVAGAGGPYTIPTGVGALTLTGAAPVPVVSGGMTIPTGVGALTLAGVEPSVRRDWTVAAGFGALSITGYGPTLQDSGATERLRVSWVDLETPAATSLTVYPDVGALSFTGYEPTPIIGGVSPNIRPG
jgi:hypothetical protein